MVAWNKYIQCDLGIQFFLNINDMAIYIAPILGYQITGRLDKYNKEKSNSCHYSLLGEKKIM